MKPIRVMIVDDSATVRQVLSNLLEQAAGIEVLGVASDPLFAIDKMQKNWPDVVLLDVEMPRMDGITFLKKIMVMRPTPVVICSTLTAKGTATAVQALAAGAVNIVTKPRLGLKQFLLDSGAEIINAVRAAACARVRHLSATPIGYGGKNNDVATTIAEPDLAETTDKVIAIGASTGGTQALEVVLTTLPRVCPGIVIVQHMPEKFTAAFAARLDSICQVEVSEARQGDRVLPGRVLVAPGGRHLQLKRNGAQYQVMVLDGPPVNRHRPSVDVLFRSVARYAGNNALGVIMTGMGDDGARGLKEMRDVGAVTLAQDEASCVVYGMPKEAVRLDGVDRSVPLANIAVEIVRYMAG